jgi:glutathione synthase/RimK-type ligase-like ATP-grasp enzyme
MRLGILTSFNEDYRLYIEACRELSVAHEVVDFLGPDWQRRCRDSGCDGFLARPPCDYPERKSIYDERLYFLNRIMGYPIYPSFDELFFYENKRHLSSFLAHHRLPHPPTRVFTRKEDALEYARSADYPFVSKRNIGSSATGVVIVESERQARALIRSIFGYLQPGFTLGKYYFKRRRGVPLPVFGTEQKHYAIFQKYLSIRWEWRLIRIGESCFGHQKLLDRRGLASGSRLVGWKRPPDELLFLLKETCEKMRLQSVALDVFETVAGEYLINEVQTVFGSQDESQMYVDGRPGRFLFRDGGFHFEEGHFNRNRSYNLRVEHFLQLLGGAGSR